MGRKRKPQGPAELSVELVWVDARTRAATRRKIRNPEQRLTPMIPGVANGTIWQPTVARFYYRDCDSGVQAAIKWATEKRAQGYMSWDEFKEAQLFTRIVIGAAKKRASGGGTYDPASVANKPSGKGKAPYRKMVNDRKQPGKPCHTGHGAK